MKNNWEEIGDFLNDLVVYIAFFWGAATLGSLLYAYVL